MPKVAVAAVAACGATACWFCKGTSFPPPSDDGGGGGSVVEVLMMNDHDAVRMCVFFQGREMDDESTRWLLGPSFESINQVLLS